MYSWILLYQNDINLTEVHEDEFMSEKTIAETIFSQTMIMVVQLPVFSFG